MKVLLASQHYLKHKEEFEKFNLELDFANEMEATKEQVEWADIIMGRVKEEYLDNHNHLLYYHTSFAGSDTYAKHPTINNKVPLTNSTGCFSLAMAEHMVGMTLSLAKNFEAYNKAQDKSEWLHWLPHCVSINNSNVLVLGAGSIGLEYARLMHGLGAKVTGIKRTPGIKPDYLENLYTLDKLDECLKKADIVAMALPQSNETVNIMNRDRLNLLKEGCLLINVGRGSAIDDEALIELLKQHKIKAALDVFKKEPLDSNNPYWELDNCMVLPHITGKPMSDDVVEKLNAIALYNLDAFLNHKPLKNVVDYNTGYKASNSL